jgi:hypothetical protein
MVAIMTDIDHLSNHECNCLRNIYVYAYSSLLTFLPHNYLIDLSAAVCVELEMLTKSWPEPSCTLVIYNCTVTHMGQRGMTLLGHASLTHKL